MLDNKGKETTANKSAKKSRLGRGLGSLLGGSSMIATENAEAISPVKEADTQSINLAQEADAKATEIEHHKMVSNQVNDESRVWQIDIEKIRPNEKQPRKVFAKEALKELAASIKVQGILMPIVGRKKAEGGFEIIAGERRWRAAQMAGLKKVPVILKQVEEKVSLELALIENIQRENLNPVEEAEAYKYLTEKYGMTQQEVATQVGKERATVANSLRLLTLPVDVLNMLSEKKLTMGHAKALLSLGDPKKQKALATQIFDEKISVRLAEKLVKNALKEANPDQVAKSTKNDVKDRVIRDLETDLQKALGTKVTIDYKNAKGKITLNFYSDGELNRIIDKLKA